jgi:YcxB-like protein
VTVRTVEFDLDEPLVRLAHRTYVKRTVGMTALRYLWAPLPFLVIGGLFLLGGDTAYYAGITIIGAGLALWLYTGGVIWRLYHRKVRDTLEHINRMSRPHFRFEFTDEGVSSKTELSSGQLAWKAFRELYRTPDVWLLFITKTRYVILPTASVAADVRDFILKKCAEHHIVMS